ncbi:MAG TPA: ribonuclease III [Abditibacteriaceae bacterium]|jgi:ribonuclease-3
MAKRKTSTVDIDRTFSLPQLCEKLGVQVPDDLLILALTHPSALNAKAERTAKSNQRLEFLGDTVVALVVAEHLYRSDPNLPEGVLTQRKAAAVRGSSLAQAAKRLDLGAHLNLGTGEIAAGGRDRETILADAFEAVLGAIFLHAGFEAARDFVLRVLAPEIESVAARAANAKNSLQEHTQSIGLGTPSYETVQSGRDANGAPLFVARVVLSDGVYERGEGLSKQAAEQAAAAATLHALLA